MSILRNSLCGAALAGLLCLGAAAHARPQQTQKPDQSEPGKKSQKSVESVSGKVASIGSGGSAFTLSVDGGENKSMEFVVDKNTKVTGQVREGSAVTVEYQAMENGQFLAVSVTANA
jgi:hypothetical protein